MLCDQVCVYLANNKNLAQLVCNICNGNLTDLFYIPIYIHITNPLFHYLYRRIANVAHYE